MYVSTNDRAARYAREARERIWQAKVAQVERDNRAKMEQVAAAARKAGK